jgi:hypothetical protein
MYPEGCLLTRRERHIHYHHRFIFWVHQKKIKGIVIDTLDVWTKPLPEPGAEAIGAKYKAVSWEAMTPSKTSHFGND